MRELRVWSALVPWLSFLVFETEYASCAPNLIGASLTWQVNSLFTTGTRSVSFNLRSAYNVTGLNCQGLKSADPTKIGTAVSVACPSIIPALSFGKLCFDQILNPSVPLSANQDCSSVRSADNNFVIKNYDTISISGVTIVYGELQVNFTVDPTYNRVVAYLNRVDKASNDPVASFIQNSMYTDTNGYWNGLPSNLFSSPSLWLQRTPACATIIRLCTAPCTDRPPNYYSPVPVLPLAIPVPSQGFQLKAFDYDGHPMLVRTETTPGLLVAYENVTSLMQAGGGAALPGPLAAPTRQYHSRRVHCLGSLSLSLSLFISPSLPFTFSLSPSRSPSLSPCLSQASSTSRWTRTAATATRPPRASRARPPTSPPSRYVRRGFRSNGTSRERVEDVEGT